MTGRDHDDNDRKRQEEKMTMKTLIRTLTVPLLIAAGTVTGSIAAHHTPVDAANGPCYDYIKDNPTPVHAGPGREYPVVAWKRAGQVVTGPCETMSGDWYVVNDIHVRGGYAYIWASHLRYLSRGHCYDGHLRACF